MPNPLSVITPALECLGRNLNILPATGTAVEDPQHPDQDEIDDLLVHREMDKEITAFAEVPEPSTNNIYRPTPPKMPNGRIVTLPSSGELKIGLLKDALREAGLSEAQFPGPVEIEEGAMEYTAIIYKAEEGGYWAKVPCLPGCYSQGETVDETLANIKEAIESHIMALQEAGQEIPQEKSVLSGRVEVDVALSRT